MGYRSKLVSNLPVVKLKTNRAAFFQDPSTRTRHHFY